MGLEEELKDDIEGKIKFVASQTSTERAALLSRKFEESYRLLHYFTSQDYYPYVIMSTMARICFIKENPEYFLDKFILYLEEKCRNAMGPKSIIQQIVSKIPLTYKSVTLSKSISGLI